MSKIIRIFLKKNFIEEYQFRTPVFIKKQTFFDNFTLKSMIGLHMTTLVMVAACTRIEKLKKKGIIIVDQTTMIATTTAKVLFLTPKLKIYNNCVNIVRI